MKLEAGKRYVTKSGWITPPMEVDSASEGTLSVFCGTDDLKCGIGVHSWSREGRYFSQMGDQADIVEEYVEGVILEDDPITWQFLSEVGFEVEPSNTLFHWKSAPDVKLELIGCESLSGVRCVCFIGRKTQLKIENRKDVRDLVRLLQKGV